MRNRVNKDAIVPKKSIRLKSVSIPKFELSTPISECCCLPSPGIAGTCNLDYWLPVSRFIALANRQYLSIFPYAFPIPASPF